jgi:hypothetical protein
MFPEYSIGMGAMSLSVGVLAPGDILHPPQQDEKYTLELAQCNQTCKYSTFSMSFMSPSLQVFGVQHELYATKLASVRRSA